MGYGIRSLDIPLLYGVLCAAMLRFDCPNSRSAHAAPFASVYAIDALAAYAARFCASH